MILEDRIVTWKCDYPGCRASREWRGDMNARPDDDGWVGYDRQTLCLEHRPKMTVEWIEQEVAVLDSEWEENRRQREALLKREREIQARCPHQATTLHMDSSGSEFKCLLCGKFRRQL